MLKWRLVSLITAILLLVSGMTIPANAAEYIYDNLNRLTSVTYDNGQKIEYQYDAGGNLVNVTHTDIGAPKVISTDPADGAVDVESNKVITVTFNETVLEDINLASISITNTVDNTTVNYAPNINNNILSLTPVEELSFNTAYSVNIPVGAVKDAAGNAFANQYAFSFTTGADLVVPTVAIISPVNNGIITGPVEIIADATDNVGVTKVEFYINDLKAGERLIEPWVYQWDPALGDYTLTAKAYDAAGNVATSAAVFVQRRANVTINNPADGVTIGGIINSFTAISDEPLTGNVELYIDGAYKQNVAANGGTQFTITYDWDTNQYANGTSHVIEIGGYTQTGNFWSQGRSNVTVDNTIDITPPAVTITSPSDQSTKSGLVEIIGDAADAVGVTKVEFYVDDALLGEDLSAPFTYSWQTTVGIHTLSAKAYDAAGNVGSSSNVTVKVPTKITIVNPAEGSTIVGNVASFDAISSDPMLGWVALNIDGVAVDSVNLTTPSTSVTYDYVWDTSQYANGSSHEIRVTGHSEAGNVYSAGTITVTVDNSQDTTAPTVSITSPSDGSTVGASGNMVTLKASATDNVKVTKVEFYVDNIYVGESSAAPYEYNWLSTVGTHTLSAKAYDLAGNIGVSSSKTINVGTTIAVISPEAGSTIIGNVSSFSVTSNDPLLGYVSLKIDGVSADGIDLTAPATSLTFDYVWDTSQYANGSSHEIKVSGHTAAGTVYSSSTITVVVDNSLDQTAPTVSITSPSNNSTRSPSGTTETIQASATDNVGVIKVEFYLDDVLLGEDLSAPYAYDWQTIVGTHTLSAKAYDAAGNVGTSSNVTVNVPTQITITSPVAGSTVVGTVNSFNAVTDDPLLGYVSLKIDGVSADGIDLTAPATSLTFDYVWDTSQYANGSSHEIKVSGHTAAGTVYSSSTITVVVDNSLDQTAPTVSITSPSNNSTRSPSGTTETIQASATDNVGVIKVEFYLDDVLLGEDLSAPYAYDWQTIVGTHTLSAKAYDAAGNVGVSSNVTVNVPTQITITSPSNGSTVTGSITSFSAVSSDPMLGWVALNIDGVSVDSVNLTTAGTSVTYDYVWDTSQYANGSSHEIRVTGHTAAGNIYSAAAITVVVDNGLDTAAPTVSITSPADTSTVGAAGSTVTIQATATDNVGVTKVEFYVDGVLLGEDLSAPYTYNWQTIVGTHTLSAKAYDAAGNVGVSSNITVNVPTQITITSPTNGSTVAGSITSFSAVSSDAMLGWVALNIDGVSVDSVNLTTAGTSVTYDYVWDTLQYANGSSHEIRVTGHSEAGNIYSSAAITVVVDNGLDTAAPTVSITSPADTSTVGATGSTVTIQATATDNVGVTKVEFYVDGVLLGEDLSAPYTYSWQTTVGTHTLSAKAYDAAGNVGVSSNITVNVPTQITITSPANGSTVAGSITSFSAVSSDAMLGWVALNIDGVSVDSVNLTTAGTSVTYDYVWDTLQYANGSSHEIRVTGHSEAGNIYSSGTITVTVDNSIP